MKNRLVFGITGIALLLTATVLWTRKKSDPYGVLIVANATLANKSAYVLDAYRSVLQEEGIPFQVVAPRYLLSRGASGLLRHHPAVIFPDAVAQALPEDLAAWVDEYVARGGHAAVIYDAGIKDRHGAYRDRALFTRLCGVNYSRYAALKHTAYVKGSLAFTDNRSSRFFQIPTGKLDAGNLLGGYVYGSLHYPASRTVPEPDLRVEEVYAYSVSGAGPRDRHIALVLRKRSPGSVLYVNMPLGFLKAYSDDLPLRAILRTFLFSVAEVPHLVNTAGGKAGLVFNWHIDSSIDWKSIDAMKEQGYLRDALQYSLHITAGDYRDTPGDGLGFDAAGRGRAPARALLPYGSIGSHGGWAHNWYAVFAASATWGDDEMRRCIRDNNDALEQITGIPVREYSAPNGVHPQPRLTRILEELGFSSYYYTGDCGSAPNRTFISGALVSRNVIAFPIMPFGKSASLSEMAAAGKKEAAVLAWLIATADYAIENRTVRLVYSHPYDIPQYPEALRLFLDYLEKKQAAGVLDVRPMSYFADFLLRFLKTDAQFELGDGALSVTAHNPETLTGLMVAVPRNRYNPPAAVAPAVRDDGRYWYIPFTAAARDETIVMPVAAPHAGGSQ